MTHEQRHKDLAQEIATGCPEYVCGQLAHWLSCPRFAGFVEEYREKIRRKFRQAQTDEDKLDVLAELEIARRILAHPSFSIEYEPHGSEVAAPDFRVCTETASFYAETKRIREAQAMSQLNDCMNRIVSALRAIPSPLCFSIKWLDLAPDVETLRKDLEKVITECVRAIHLCKETLAPGESTEFPIDVVPHLSLYVEHIVGRAPDTPTGHLGDVLGIPFTQRESFKFTDLLLDYCRRQCRGDLPNVLVIRCDSTTHDARELEQAASEIWRHLGERNETFFLNKDFAGIGHLKERWKLLTAAVVVTGATSVAEGGAGNLVWINKRSALRLNEKVLDHFHEL